jgi:acetolactate synthase I/II/III large subunit
MDIMKGSADGEVLTPTVPENVGPADVNAINDAASLISSAKKPVLLLGLLASEEHAAKALRVLLAKTKLPVVCTYQGAGVVPREHFDRFGGRIGLFHTQPADKLLDAADTVIAVGYDPIEYEPSLWNQNKKRNLIDVDVVPANIDRDYRPQLQLTGNIAATVRGLTTHLEQMTADTDKAIFKEIAQDRAKFSERAASLNSTPIHPMRLVHEIQTLLSDDMTLCLDMGSFHIWMARHLYSFRPRQVLMTNGQQTLGVALPWAIGACLVRPNEKVLSISGDGGFLFSAMELETAVRLKCNLVHMVWIDHSYDMVRFQEVAKYGRASGVDFGPVDVVRFAEAFGAKGLKIETSDQISFTIKNGLEMQGPVIIGVEVDYRDNYRFMEIMHPDVLD